MSAIAGAIEHLNLQFKFANLADDGTFDGHLSVYGVIDRGGDVVMAGSMTKSIAESGGRVPLLWQHDPKEPIGDLMLVDTPESLTVKGAIDLATQRGREAYSLIKKGIVKGLSIGFEILDRTMEGKVRLLKEIRLWEGSIVTFPMNPFAQITAVKGQKDFNSSLADEQLMNVRYMMFCALHASLDEIFWDEKRTPEEKVAESSASIQQFSDAYAAAVPEILQALDRMRARYMSAGGPENVKAGRTVSAATRSVLEKVMEMHGQHISISQEASGLLKALLDASASADEEDKGAEDMQHKSGGCDLGSLMSDTKAELVAALGSVYKN